MDQITSINYFIYGPDDSINIYRFLQQIDETETDYITPLIINWNKQIRSFIEFDEQALYIYLRFIKTHPHFPDLTRLVDMIADSYKWERNENPELMYRTFIRSLLFECNT